MTITMSHARFRFSACAALALLALASQGASSQDAPEGPLPFDALPADAASPFGGMAISPTRLVMDAGGRGETVTLYNSGGAPVTYRIEAVDLALDAEGSYRALEEGEEAAWSALPYIRYSPRQVTLQPGERQSVRVIARAPRDLPSGELRSHLRFSSIPLVEDAGEDEGDAPPAGDGRSVSVSVGLEYRITIPVLLRTGTPDGGTAIAGATPAPDNGNGKALLVRLARTGQRSDYGVLKAFDAAGQQVGVLRGLAVLPPSAERVVSLPLTGDTPPVRLTFEEETGPRETGTLLAEYTLD